MLIFIGPPGSGKGTQSRLLNQRLGLKIFSVGEILREEIANNSLIGKKIEQTIRSGHFADLDIVISLMESRIQDADCILDGFPRNIEQADSLEKFIQSNDQFDLKNVIAVNFVVPEDKLIERLAHRRICRICDASILCSASECNFCGHESGDAYTRCDDTKETIKERIKQYHDQSEPLIDYYIKRGIYFAIDATSDVESVYNQLTSCIKAKNLM